MQGVQCIYNMFFSSREVCFHGMNLGHLVSKEQTLPWSQDSPSNYNVIIMLPII